MFCWDEADVGALAGQTKRYCSDTCHKKSQAGARAQRARYAQRRRLRKPRPPCPQPGKHPYEGPLNAALEAAARRRGRDAPLYPYPCACGAWHLSSKRISAGYAAVRIATHPDGPEALRILSEAGLLPA